MPKWSPERELSQCWPLGFTIKKDSKRKKKKMDTRRTQGSDVLLLLCTRKPQTNNTEDTFLTWFSRNNDSDKIDGMDANKLANIRRSIMRSKKITDMEIELIIEQVKKGTREPEIEETDNNDILYEDILYEEIYYMKRDILEELSIVMHTDIAEREPLLKIRQIHKFKKHFNLGNIALREICKERDPDLTELNQLIYATSKALQEKSGIKNKRKRNKGKRQGASKP